MRASVISHTRASASTTSAAAFALWGEIGSRGRAITLAGRLRLRMNVGSAASVQRGTRCSSAFAGFGFIAVTKIKTEVEGRG